MERLKKKRLEKEEMNEETELTKIECSFKYKTNRKNKQANSQKA